MDTENMGMRLLKKGQTGIIRMIFSRMGIILVLLALNILLLAAFGWFEQFLPHLFGGTLLFTAIMVIYIINSRMDPTAKITWLVVVMLFPVFGSLFYLFTCTDIGHRAVKKKLEKVYAATPKQNTSNDAFRQLALEDPGAAAMVRYVSGITGIPVSTGTDAAYCPIGEKALEAILCELKKAETSIYLEYFIVQEGVMWGQILDILSQKAAQGVDVRVMYDGTCEFDKVPRIYPKKLRQLGIKCHVFAPVTPFLSTHYNYRDHRKILTIDGKVAFTGGINLADEYINVTHPHGHWKDNAIMLKGDAAKSMERMFLQIWNLGEEKITFPQEEPALQLSQSGSGFVMPYYDDPMDRELVGRQVYMDILNRAQRYVYIMTPYLILDDELESALAYAAKRGVEVTLVLPGIPDHQVAYALAKTHYPVLLEAGVKIYEYTPGFVHAKVVVADGREAVVGTINFDYRSLYHHFECAVYLNGVPCIADVARDVEETARKSSLVTMESVRKDKLFYKIAGPVLKAVATLL